MSRHNPEKRLLKRRADNVPVTMSGDAEPTRTLPGSSNSLTARVWSSVVANYVQLSQNGHCLAILI